MIHPLSTPHHCAIQNQKVSCYFFHFVNLSLSQNPLMASYSTLASSEMTLLTSSTRSLNLLLFTIVCLADFRRQWVVGFALNRCCPSCHWSYGLFYSFLPVFRSRCLLSDLIDIWAYSNSSHPSSMSTKLNRNKYSKWMWKTNDRRIAVSLSDLVFILIGEYGLRLVTQDNILSGALSENRFLSNLEFRVFKTWEIASHLITQEKESETWAIHANVTLFILWILIV